MKFDKNIHYSIDIEAAILGACMLEREGFGRTYKSIEPEHFYNQFHQRVYETMQSMYLNSIPIDTFTVIDQFSRIQRTQSFGKDNVTYFITHLTNYVVSGAHIEYHCHVVKTMWMEREIIKLTQGGATMQGDVRQKIADLQQRIFDIQQKTVEHDWQDMTTLMVNLYKHQEEMKLSGGIGLQCGISRLDKENGGFHPGQMVVIGARPSMGKSALAGAFAMHMATNKNKVGIISLEMSNNEIAARLAAIDTNTDFRVLYRGLYIDEREANDLYRRISQNTANLPIFVSDKTDVDIIAIKSKAEKLKALHGLDCLIIDYLQLVDTPESNNRNRENEISKISRHCKLMAKDLNVPVILLCQLNREVTKRHGEQRYPQLSDIRESGSIEQDADIVMFLHRDYMAGMPVDTEGRSTEFRADLIIRKWRNGNSNFVIPLTFDPPKMKFTEVKNNGFRPLEVDYQSDNPI